MSKIEAANRIYPERMKAAQRKLVEKITLIILPVTLFFTGISSILNYFFLLLIHHGGPITLRDPNVGRFRLVKGKLRRVYVSIGNTVEGHCVKSLYISGYCQVCY